MNSTPLWFSLYLPTHSLDVGFPQWPAKTPLAAVLRKDRVYACTPAAQAQGVKPGRSEEHTSELQSLMRISYAVFCLKKKTPRPQSNQPYTFTSHHTQLHYHNTDSPLASPPH